MSRVLLPWPISWKISNSRSLSFSIGESDPLGFRPDTFSRIRADMAGLTRRLVTLTLEHEGTFYLPYQPHYTREQVAQAYPTLDEFFALKRQHDPEERFRNAFYTRFS